MLTFARANFDSPDLTIREHIGSLCPSKSNLSTACVSLLTYLSPKITRRQNLLNTETSLSTQKLKERIVASLNARYRKTGMNDAVSWRGIWIEFGVAEEDFCKALNAAAEERPRALIVFTDSDHIKLNLKVRSDTRVPSDNMRSKAGISEALTSRFFRIFAFGKGKPRQAETQLESTPSSTSAEH